MPDDFYYLNEITEFSNNKEITKRYTKDTPDSDEYLLETYITEYDDKGRAIKLYTIDNDEERMLDEYTYSDDGLEEISWSYIKKYDINKNIIYYRSQHEEIIMEYKNNMLIKEETYLFTKANNVYMKLNYFEYDINNNLIKIQHSINNEIKETRYYSYTFKNQ